MAARDPFPVLCDRCRAEGVAGEAEFAELAGLGDILEFEPVPRRVARADGWTPEIQRAYVAALAVTGSERQASAVVERAAWGVTQLRKVEGNEGFFAACAKALEIYQERERVRRSDNLLAAAHGEAARTRGRPRLAWSGAASRRLPVSDRPPDPEREAEARARATDEFVRTILGKYWIKLNQERKARLEGRIIEADFYVRQLTWIEVAIDLGTGEGFKVFEALRRGDFDLVDIVETPMSRLFDAARRKRWKEAGEPDRPDGPPEDRLVDQGGFSTDSPDSWTSGGSEHGSYAEWRAALAAEHEAAARAQAEWEEKAREDSEEWRARVEGEASEPDDGS